MSTSARTRRNFLWTSAAVAGSATAGVALRTFLQRSAHADSAAVRDSISRLIPVPDESTGLPLLLLPEGFRYSSYSWAGDPLSTGGLCPPLHDGMGVVSESDGIAVLIRNHEVTQDGRAIGSPAVTYDPIAGAGCTRLRFDMSQETWLDSEVALSGTHRNCAGGITPWGSWLTCEETVDGPGGAYNLMPLHLRESHGWIFEVPSSGDAKPTPLKDMGRFVHEAVAVDPLTGFVYETEDRDTAGFYRFRPNRQGVLGDGGSLQMLKVAGHPDLRAGSRVNQTYDVQWVDIPDPYRPHSPGTADALGIFHQGKSQKATTFARLEGCWMGAGVIYFVSTSGGAAKSGQVWSYTPAEEQLQLIFESPAAHVLDNPDNLTVHTSGSLLLCEDGSVEPQRLHWLTPDGKLSVFAANNIILDGQKNGLADDYRDEEWAGPTFSADGQWLFVNVQTPGVTFAITGPWDKLAGM